VGGKAFGRILGGVVAGAWGGSLLGVLEAAMIVATSPSLSEFGLFPFAVCAYGVMGAGLGAAASVLLWAAGWKPERQKLWLAVHAAAGMLPIGFVVGRYHLAQRVFAEQFPALWSAAGLAWTTGLVIASALLAVLGAALVSLVAGRESSWAAPRLLLLWLVGCATAALGARWFTPVVPEPQRRATAEGAKPNVVLVIVDTLRADALGFASGKATTPRIDALAREAVYFRNAYAQSSWTRPSVATILTGLHPVEHGAIQKFDPLPEGVVTIAEFLRDAGYWTAGFVTNINVAPIFNFQQGFGEYHYLAPSFYFGASDSATRLSAYKLLRLVRERFFRRHLYFYHYYQDAKVMREHVARWLAAKPPEPFFLLLHYMDPHDPYFEIPYNGKGIARVLDPNPPATQAAEMRRLYDADVTYFDEQFGELLSEFRRRGLLDRTLLVVTADHGEEFHEHGGWWHGTTLYEEQLRVPLMIRRPGGVGAGTERTDWAQTLDLAPTILAQAGLPATPSLRGRDLFSDQPPPEFLYAQETLEGNRLESLHWQHWKLVVANPDNPRGLPAVALFDLMVDPEERNNLAASNAEVVRAMQLRLDQARSLFSSRARR